MKGKSKCKILKDIRKEIARKNDIEFVTSECKYKGDCLGTCPKCEAEVRYLESELKKRKDAGKQIAVAGIAAAFVVGGTSCDIIDSVFTVQGDMAYEPESSVEIVDGEMPSEISEDITMGVEIPNESNENYDECVEMGEVPDVSDEELMGDPVPDESEDDSLLMGDVIIIETSAEEPDAE